MKFCYECGYKLNKGTEKFCPECGENFKKEISTKRDNTSLIDIEYAKKTLVTDILPEHWWEDLLSSIYQKKCIPFIGEYNSNELAKYLATEFDYPLEGPYKLSKVAQFVAIEQGNELFPKQIMSRKINELRIPDFSLEAYQKSPHEILARLDLPIYITTNYDHFLEYALRSKGKEPFTEICRWNDKVKKAIENELITSLFNKKSNYTPTPNQPLIYHLYGSIDFPESMVLTERDYHEFVINTNGKNSYDVLPASLRRELITSLLLFIGYTFDDINFSSIFQGVLSSLSKTNSIAVIQVPLVQNENLKQQKIMEYMKKYLANMYGIISYLEFSDQFIQDLIGRWKTFKNEYSVN